MIHGQDFFPKTSAQILLNEYALPYIQLWTNVKKDNSVKRKIRTAKIIIVTYPDRNTSPKRKGSDAMHALMSKLSMEK